MSHELDEHFVKFTGSLTTMIKGLKAGSPEFSVLGATKILKKEDTKRFLALQRRQVERLYKLECNFRELLCSNQTGLNIYNAFISYIRDDCHNILDARPYFRERQDVFTPRIANALKARDPVALAEFNINYRFIRFAMGAMKSPSRDLLKCAQEIAVVRTDLVVLNMPLAIARARIFFSRTPRSHLDLMDLVQIACIGLMSGVDKFVLPYTRMWRGVAIGRIVGDCIEQYSATMAHLYPRDKRILYNVNKISGRAAGNLDLDEIAEAISLIMGGGKKTTASDVADLMSAASCVSMSSSTNTEDGSVCVADAVAAPESWQPDVRYEETETSAKLQIAIPKLSLYKQKFLALKGIR